MLADRFYMRKPEFGPRRSAVVTLLIVNVVAFFGLELFQRASPFPLGDYLELSLGGLRRGFLWQLLTFQICHANFLHLFFNCFAIFMFGRDVEEALGQKAFFALYVLSGVAGGVVQSAAAILFGGAFAGHVVGASAGAFGLTTAYCILFPDRTLLLSFILPLKAKYVLLLSVVYTVFRIIFPADNVAHAAHMGGIAAGFLFVRYAIHWDFSRLRLGGTRKTPRRSLVKVQSHKSGWSAPHPLEPESPSEDFLSREVDPILEKISAQGIQSLTDKERKILDRARTRMGKGVR